jgi:Zn-dependent metalloprotease
MVSDRDEIAKASLTHKANRHKTAQLIHARSLKPDSQLADEVDKFLLTRPEVSPEWNIQTGGVMTLTGNLAEPLPGSPTEVARSFLMQNFSLLGLKERLEDLSEIDRYTLADIETVKFQQTHQNIPIFGAELLVGVDPDNKVMFVSSENLVNPEAKIKAPEPTSRTKAKRIALDDLGKDSKMRGDIQSEVVWFPTEEDYVMSYHFILPMDEPFGDWDYFIDASSGDILDSYNSIRFSSFGPRGLVYMENPDESVEKDNVILKNIKYPYKFLKGYYTRVLNEDAPEAVASSSWAFYFDDANTHFDEVQLYYSMERTCQYFQRLGFRGFLSKNRNKVLTGTVHKYTDYDNAFYSPATGQIYFGDGSGPPGGLNHLSREVDVVAHEFTHAVIDEFCPGISGIDAGGLHEGIADYFACSMTNDHYIGEYVVPGSGGIRDIENDNRYPGAPTQPHARGLVWGGACWKLRDALNEYHQYNELSMYIADFLVFNALGIMNHKWPTYKYMKDRMLLVDKYWCGGEYKSTIKNIFETQRGIPA